MEELDEKDLAQMEKNLRDRLSFVGIYDLYDTVYENGQFISDLIEENKKLLEAKKTLERKLDSHETRIGKMEEMLTEMLRTDRTSTELISGF